MRACKRCYDELWSIVSLKIMWNNNKQRWRQLRWEGERYSNGTTCVELSKCLVFLRVTRKINSSNNNCRNLEFPRKFHDLSQSRRVFLQNYPISFKTAFENVINCVSQDHQQDHSKRHSGITNWNFLMNSWRKVGISWVDVVTTVSNLGLDFSIFWDLIVGCCSELMLYFSWDV